MSNFHEKKGHFWQIRPPRQFSILHSWKGNMQKCGVSNSNQHPIYNSFWDKGHNVYQCRYFQNGHKSAILKIFNILKSCASSQYIVLATHKIWKDCMQPFWLGDAKHILLKKMLIFACFLLIRRPFWIFSKWPTFGIYYGLYLKKYYR